MPIKGILKSRIPVKIWSDLATVESRAMDQLKNVASLPFVFKHVAVMADVHVGKGATVGSVITSKDAIIPAAVGVDIGCGMCAVRLSDAFKESILQDLPGLRHKIEAIVPVGFNGNAKISKDVETWPRWGDAYASNYLGDDRALIDKAHAQMGSLGGGNHFIEICLGLDVCGTCRGTGKYLEDPDTCADCLGTGHALKESIWIMLHSGSRNVGKSLAEKHIEAAKGLMKKMLIGLPDPDLAYLPRETREFDRYISDLAWCQDYAAKNREIMLDRVATLITGTPFWRKHAGEVINCHHNYVAWENHYGENCLVTRKGAIRARVGDIGIIPGSMGTRSFIVRGLGNPESFNSASHGAGRRMSRSEAKRRYTIEDLRTQTMGVECRKDEGVIDEIPLAYKDVDEVMENQKDLVVPTTRLKAVLCVKG